MPVGGDDDPPWHLDEPDELVDDLPAPTRARASGRPPVAAAEDGPWGDEPDVGLDAPAAAAPTSGVALPPPLPEFERTELGTRWYELVCKCNEASSLVALVRELAMQAELIQCAADGDGGQTWTLRVARETLRNPTLVDKLAAAMRVHVGAGLKLAVVAGEAQDSPTKRDAAEADRRQREAIAAVQSDPTVRALLAQFRTARILPGSIKPL